MCTSLISRGLVVSFSIRILLLFRSKSSRIEGNGEEGAQPPRDLASKVDVVEGGAWINLVCVFDFERLDRGRPAPNLIDHFLVGRVFSTLVIFCDLRLLL